MDTNWLYKLFEVSLSFELCNIKLLMLEQNTFYGKITLNRNTFLMRIGY